MIQSRLHFKRPALPIRDIAIESFLREQNLSSFRSWVDSESSQKEFFNVAEEWLKPFLFGYNLSGFQGRYLTSGTTGSFQNFYQIHNRRRLRVFSGEYPFHRDLFRDLGLPWEVLDGRTGIDRNDFLIMSLPFSGDGNIHPMFVATLQRCEELQVPVLIDCAFAGLSDLSLPDLSEYRCIHTISFSLSKFFDMGHFRCGFEFSKYEKGANALLSEWDYGPKVAAYLGQKMIQRFPFDFLYKKYRGRQLELCQQFDLSPSSTLLFGLGDDSWDEFSRDGYANRICLSEAF